MELNQSMVHKKILFPLIVVLSLAISFNIKSQSLTPEEAFQKILNSFSSVDFKGKLMFISYGPEDGPVREALIIKKAPDKSRIEFISPKEIKGSGMITNGKERWPIFNEAQAGRRDHPPRPEDKDRKTDFPSRSRRPPPGPPPDGMMEDFPYKNIQFLLKNYNIRILNGGNVADRNTYLLELESKISPRPSRKLWIDKEKGVILKMEKYDSQKRLRGFFVYSEINYDPKIDDSVFRGGPPKIMGVFKQRDGRGREEIWNNEQGALDTERVIKKSEMNLSLPERLPAGFVIESVTVLKFGERKTVHLKYTDGLAIISAFQSLYSSDKPPGRPGDAPGRRQEPEKIKVKSIECKIIQAGPMLVFTWNYNNMNFTLMGELDRNEMIKMVGIFIP